MVEPDGIGNVKPVKSILMPFSVGDQTTLVLVCKSSLAPTGADIVFGTRSVDRGTRAVAIEIHFYFAFTPPGRSIVRVDVDAYADAEEAAAALHTWQEFQVLADGRLFLPAPVCVEVERVGCRRRLLNEINFIEKHGQVDAGFVTDDYFGSFAKGHGNDADETAAFGVGEKGRFEGHRAT